jgi:hypothetical protein
MGPEGFGEGEGSGMRCSLLLAVFGLSITDVASFAQGPPGDQRLSSTRSGTHDAGFFATTGVVRFQFIQGRLCLDSPRHRKGSQSCNEQGVYESITVTSERGIPSLHYVFQTDEHHITLNVQHSGTVRMESWFPQSAERSILEQPDFGMIIWRLARGDLSDRHQGATLMHLRHDDQESFDLHFGVLIQRLLRGQSLGVLSEAVGIAMLEQAGRGGTPSAVEIKDMVELLRSPRVTKRVLAHRQLISWGTPVLPVLQQLSPDELDAEQTARIRNICLRLRPLVDDTPASLAKLLVNDKAYWDKIARKFDSPQLQVANQHLTHFGVPQIPVISRPEHQIAARPGSQAE